MGAFKKGEKRADFCALKRKIVEGREERVGQER